MNGYGEDADVLARQYESLKFADVHGAVLHLFPEVPGLVLDVGAGTGRDAAALSRLGHRVVAVEPTAELRAFGQAVHSEPTEWIDDALPELPRVSERFGTDGSFDLILLSAVWMHLDEQERAVGMKRLAGLLAAGGRIVMTLRHGPAPRNRRMYEVTAREAVADAQQAGLTCVHQSCGGDLLGRPELRWSYLAFELRWPVVDSRSWGPRGCPGSS
ncbi:class I SAM-dependent methyltransferase [Actinomadura rudentiformis]|uniref:Class I SAM-dependent methyltransferase n=1 Tax=Actinomadura rudentiformis TaxID=359158 RepID=A0A6H9YLR9_9ACTN|nr:class I SAM-dependent methyltransferase [Actinomadura rudentiformis]KAB2344086.1 class I SAM-dependent methyltransferase [Actinomadura rudentiformis]